MYYLLQHCEMHEVLLLCCYGHTGKEQLTNFEEIIPGSYKLLPQGQVWPDGLGEEDDELGQPEHFPHREDELLGFLRHHFTDAAHPVLKQH